MYLFLQMLYSPNLILAFFVIIAEASYDLCQCSPLLYQFLSTLPYIHIVLNLMGEAFFKANTFYWTHLHITLDWFGGGQLLGSSNTLIKLDGGPVLWNYASNSVVSPTLWAQLCLGHRVADRSCKSRAERESPDNLGLALACSAVEKDVNVAMSRDA